MEVNLRQRIAQLRQAARVCVQQADELEALLPTEERASRYDATEPVIDGVELITGRLACCGSGPDRRDDRTGQRLHLPGCELVGVAW